MERARVQKDWSLQIFKDPKLVGTVVLPVFTLEGASYSAPSELPTSLGLPSYEGQDVGQVVGQARVTSPTYSGGGGMSVTSLVFVGQWSDHKLTGARG